MSYSDRYQAAKSTSIATIMDTMEVPLGHITDVERTAIECALSIAWMDSFLFSASEDLNKVEDDIKEAAE